MLKYDEEGEGEDLILFAMTGKGDRWPGLQGRKEGYKLM